MLMKPYDEGLNHINGGLNHVELEVLLLRN